MGIFDQFLSAASAREAQREQEGRQGRIPTHEDLIKWWEELQKKRLERERSMSGMDQMMEERIFGKNGGKLYDPVNGPETGNLISR
jgi:hypothetical protein